MEEQRVPSTRCIQNVSDKAPHEVYAALLDEGIYLCSVRTMYRILEKHNEVRERRNQLRHPTYQKPELLATVAKTSMVMGYNQTQLACKMDIFLSVCNSWISSVAMWSVGWLAFREQAVLAQRLIADTCQKQDIKPEQLVIHADRGSSMTSKTGSVSSFWGSWYN